jgi:hypothetical protein
VAELKDPSLCALQSGPQDDAVFPEEKADGSLRPSYVSRELLLLRTAPASLCWSVRYLTSASHPPRCIIRFAAADAARLPFRNMFPELRTEVSSLAVASRDIRGDDAEEKAGAPAPAAS